MERGDAAGARFGVGSGRLAAGGGSDVGGGEALALTRGELAGAVAAVLCRLGRVVAGGGARGGDGAIGRAAWRGFGFGEDFALVAAGAAPAPDATPTLKPFGDASACAIALLTTDLAA